MNNSHYYCVIMAGGIGSRFWPVSREAKPKQFLPLSRTGKSFIRLAYERFAKIVPESNILVVTQQRYHDLVKAQLPEVLEENILLEPYSRNTAPCIALATYTLLKRDPEAVMVATPADHVIFDEEIFQKTMLDALNYAAWNDALITLGIVPTRPDTNFGYIQGTYGQTVVDGRPIKVKTFTEKPDADLAEVFFNSGEFYWNSGIFVWNAETIRQELEKYLPEVKSLFWGWESEIDSADDSKFLENAYTSISNISIDYAVMEKTDKAWVYPSTFRWHDIGSWESLFGYLSKEYNSDTVAMTGPALCKGNKNTLIHAEDKTKLIAVRGLENYIVVDTEDVLLICPRNEKDAKDIIANVAMPGYEKFK